jgi:hypothetical protein
VKEPSEIARLPIIKRAVDEAFGSREFLKDILPSYIAPGRDGMRMLSVVSRDNLAHMLERVLDEQQFLSNYGVRSLSRAHEENPYRFSVGGSHHEVAYRPGVSDSRMLGGNSNWRGPVWFPMNFLLIQAIATFAEYYDDTFTIEYPTGSGNRLRLREIADELARRLVSIFARDEAGDGSRPVFGGNQLFDQDPHWRDYVPFHEFFHGETGEGLGASHQTGWTALVALLIQYRGQLCFNRAGLSAGVAEVA